MKQIIPMIIIFLFCVSTAAGQTSKNLWKAELDDDVKKIQPVLNGKYLFLSSDEYAWLYENATGKKVWSVEIDEFSEKAVHQTVNDTLYLVANEDTLVCYDMLNRTIAWKKSYKGIEQGDFTGLKQLDTLLILSFKTVDIGVSLNDGAEYWRTPIEYDRSLPEQGAVNAVMLNQARKYIVLTDKDECVLLSMDDGKKLLTVPACEPYGDLVKSKRAWYYTSPSLNIAAFIFEKYFIVINTETNKLVAQVQLKVSDQYNPLIATAVGCAVTANDRVVHLNALTNKVSHVPVSVDKLRNIIVAQTDTSAIMIVGQEDKITGWDLGAGKKAWETALKFQPANGFIHRFLLQDSNDVIVTYLDPSKDLQLYLMSINVPTGKVNYRTLVAHADESLPKRNLPLPAIAEVTGPVQPSFGFENAGFDYQTSMESGSIVFLIRTSADMIMPNSERKGGEGFVRVDYKNGQLLSKNYLKIADGLSFDGGLSSIAPNLSAGSIILCPGNKNLVALDSATGAMRWMLIEQDLNDSYIFDMAMIDTVLYIRTGGYKQEYTYDKKKDKVSQDKVWEEDDYALLAVDTATGKVLWKRNFEADPGRVFHRYSLSGYARSSSHMFFADEKFLYSFSLDPMKKGMLSWKFEFSDSGIGSYDYADLFQQSVHWDAEGKAITEQSGALIFPLKQSVIAGENFTTSISQVLRIIFDREGDRLVLFGEDGIASVNASNGRMQWYHEWDYSSSSIHQLPVMLNGHIFYAVDGKGVLLNAGNGTVTASEKIDKEAGIFIMPDGSAVIAVEKDEITGFAVP